MSDNTWKGRDAYISEDALLPYALQPPVLRSIRLRYVEPRTERGPARLINTHTTIDIH